MSYTICDYESEHDHDEDDFVGQTEDFLVEEKERSVKKLNTVEELFKDVKQDAGESYRFVKKKQNVSEERNKDQKVKEKPKSDDLVERVNKLVVSNSLLSKRVEKLERELRYTNRRTIAKSDDRLYYTDGIVYNSTSTIRTDDHLYYTDGMVYSSNINTYIPNRILCKPNSFYYTYY